MSTVVNVPAGGGSWFSQNANMIGSLAGGLISVIGSAVGGNKAGNNTQPVNPVPYNVQQVQTQKDNTLLYVGVGVAAVAAIAFFVSSNKNTRKRRR
jgi:hypothetical protein